MVRTLTKSVRSFLLVESRRQAEKATEGVGACLEPATGNPELRGAHVVLKRWYRHASVRAPNPSQADMDKVTEGYAALYCQEEHPSPVDQYLLTSHPLGSMERYPWRGRRRKWNKTSNSIRK